MDDMTLPFREATIVGQKTTVTAASEFLIIIPPTGVVCALLSAHFGVSNHDTNEMMQGRIQRLSADSSSGGTDIVPQPVDEGDATDYSGWVVRTGWSGSVTEVAAGQHWQKDRYLLAGYDAHHQDDGLLSVVGNGNKGFMLEMPARTGSTSSTFDFEVRIGTLG